MLNQIVRDIRIMQSENVNISYVYEVIETPTDYHIIQEYDDGCDLEDKRSLNGGLF